MNELERAEMEADKNRKNQFALGWSCTIMFLFWFFVFAIVAGVMLYGCNG